MELKRVVVTGLGAITPIGNTVPEFWENLVNGVSGAGPITHFDASLFKTQFACEVKNFDANQYIDRKEARKMDLYTQYAIGVAKQAVEDSGLDVENEDLNKIGVIFGAGIGGIRTFEEEAGNYALHKENGPKFNPFFIPKMISDIAAGQISILYGFHGPNYATCSACATSTNAIADAFNLIRLGKANAIISGGSEAAIAACGVGGFNAMHALSTRNDSPETASRPFSASRDGFIMGEGGGCLVLEELEHAKARGAKIYAEVAGVGMSADAHHLTASHPEGLGAKLVMTNALEDAEMKPEEVLDSAVITHVLFSRNTQNNTVVLRNQIDKIRLLFRKDRESYFCFYRILGFFPRDIRFYQQALLHKSTSVRSEKGRPLNNERLEFLGDAILDAIVGDIVYKHFEGRREGFLTNTRSKIVQRETLNKLAVEIGLDKLVKYSTRSSSHNSYMYGNAFEAFIGAIYLDQGYERCKQFMEKKILKNYIDLDKMSRKEVNFKSKLIEWSQKNKMEVSFELIEQFLDRDYNPMFHTEVRIESLSAGTGTGYSKKESQQNAAQMALKKIKSDEAFKEAIETAKIQNHAAKEDIAAEENETVTENTPVAETSEVLEATDNTEPTDTVQDTAKSPETNPHTLTLND